MAAKKSGLGKGLDSLIPASSKENVAFSSAEGNRSGEQLLKISMIEPNREQPRQVFDEDGLQELADSMKQYGVLEPLLVTKRDDYYEIIAGERRWRAAKLAGITEMPAIVKEFTDQEIVEISLIENLQRENLNPIEEAHAYQRLLNEFHLKQEEVAERVSKSRTAVTNSLRLLKLDERVQQMVVENQLTTGHARALLAISDQDEQYALSLQVLQKNLSVRETEALVKQQKTPKKPKKTKQDTRSLIYQDLEEKMREVLGTKVQVTQRGKGAGKIEVEYYSEEELERLYELIMSLRKEV